MRRAEVYVYIKEGVHACYFLISRRWAGKVQVLALVVCLSLAPVAEDVQAD